MVVLTKGKEGAAVFTQDTYHETPGFSVQVKDTTGAGDAFHAAYISALKRNLDLKNCLQFANAAAAISVQHPGPRSGLPTTAEVEDFLKSQIL